MIIITEQYRVAMLKALYTDKSFFLLIDILVDV